MLEDVVANHQINRIVRQWPFFCRADLIENIDAWILSTDGGDIKPDDPPSFRAEICHLLSKSTRVVSAGATAASHIHHKAGLGCECLHARKECDRSIHLGETSKVYFRVGIFLELSPIH